MKTDKNKLLDIVCHNCNDSGIDMELTLAFESPFSGLSIMACHKCERGREVAKMNAEVKEKAALEEKSKKTEKKGFFKRFMANRNENREA